MAKSMIGNIGLPGNLYAGGAVIFDSSPYTNYYLNQQARQKAQEDAMYRYFGEMGKGLTPAGMDAKDIPGLMKRKNEWQDFMMQNRKSIARPGIDQGKAYGEANVRYNDMIDYINRSKSKVKNLASLHSILNSPQKSALLNDATQLGIHHGSLPLDHPDYKEFDPSSIQYNVAPFDNKQINSLRNNLLQYKPTEIQAPSVVDIGNRQQQITHHYRFNENQLNGIYAQGATQYHTNPSFQNMIDRVKDDPMAYHSLNETFKEHYNRDILSGEDAATAYMMSLHPDISQKTEIRTTPISPWESASAALDKEKQFYDYRHQQEAEQFDRAENFLSDQEAEAKKGGSLPYYHAGTNRWQTAYDTKFTPDQVKKIFSTRDVSGKHILTPDKVQVLDNGDYLPIYYQYDDKGQPVKGENGKIAVDSRYTKPVSRDAVKASIVSNRIIPKSQPVKPGEHVSKGTTVTKKQTFGAGGLN